MSNQIRVTPRMIPFIGSVILCSFIIAAAPFGDNANVGQETIMSDQESGTTTQGSNDKGATNAAPSKRPTIETSADQLSDEQSAHAERRPWNWDKTLAILTAFTNLGLFILGVIGAIYFHKQLKMAQESNVSSAKDTERTLRLMADTLEESRQQRIQSAQDAEASREQSRRDSENLRAQSEQHATAALEAASQSNEMTRESNRVAAEGMRIARLVYYDDHRPLIRAIGAEVEISDAKVVVQVRFKNRGKVAAADINLGGGLAIQDETFDPFSLGVREISGFYGNMQTVSVEPGEEVTFQLFDMFRRITAEDIEQLARGERSLYAYGYIHPWHDPFKLRSEHVYFSYRLHFYGGGGEPGKFTMDPWRENNVLECDKVGDELIESMRLGEKKDEDPYTTKRIDSLTVPDPPDWPVFPKRPPDS